MNSTAVRRLALDAFVVVAGGLVIGIGTQILQGWLPGGWNVLANSGVAWALGALVVGMAMPSDKAAAVAGAVAMVLASNSYYQAVEWFEHVSSGSRGAIIWSLAGLLAGPVFGVAGRWIRVDPSKRWLAVASVAGVLIGEGIHLAWYLDADRLRPAGIVELVLGASLMAVAAVRHRSWLPVIGVVVLAALAFFVAGRMIDGGFIF